MTHPTPTLLDAPWLRLLCGAGALACALGLGWAVRPGVAAIWAPLLLVGLAGAGALFFGLNARRSAAALALAQARYQAVCQERDTALAQLRVRSMEVESALTQARVAQGQWQDALKALQIQHRDLLDAYAEVAQLTRTETVGGLGTQRALEERLNRIVRGMGERRAQSPRHAFLMVEIDDLPGITARWGAHVGDFVLSVVSTRLALAQREGDLLVRWSDASFLSLIPADDPEAARACAERLREAVAAHPVALPWGDVLTLTVSLGFACWPFATDSELTWGQAVDLAAWALGQARANGGNRSVGAIAPEGTEVLPAGNGPLAPERLSEWATHGLIRAVQ